MTNKIFHFILILSVLILISNCDNPSNSDKQELISQILYFKELSTVPDSPVDTLSSFYLTSTNIWDLKDVSKKRISFEGANRVKIEVLNYQQQNSPIIIIGFKGEGEYFNHSDQLIYIGGQYGKLSMSTVTFGDPVTMKFDGIFYGFVFDDNSWDGSDEIMVNISADDSLLNTLEINPQKHIFTTRNMLKITRTNLPEILPQEKLKIQIHSEEGEYCSGAILINNVYDHPSVFRFNTGTYTISGYRIDSVYTAYYFSFSINQLLNMIES